MALDANKKAKLLRQAAIAEEAHELLHEDDEYEEELWVEEPYRFNITKCIIFVILAIVYVYFAFIKQYDVPSSDLSVDSMVETSAVTNVIDDYTVDEFVNQFKLNNSRLCVISVGKEIAITGIPSSVSMMSGDNFCMDGVVADSAYSGHILFECETELLHDKVRHLVLNQEICVYGTITEMDMNHGYTINVDHIDIVK